MSKHRGRQTKPEPRHDQESSAPQPPSDEAARRAYSLYEENGREEGHELQHWFHAEEQLRGRQSDLEGSRQNAR